MVCLSVIYGILEKIYCTEKDGILEVELVDNKYYTYMTDTQVHELGNKIISNSK